MTLGTVWEVKPPTYGPLVLIDYLHFAWITQRDVNGVIRYFSLCSESLHRRCLLMAAYKLLFYPYACLPYKPR